MWSSLKWLSPIFQKKDFSTLFVIKYQTSLTFPRPGCNQTMTFQIHFNLYAHSSFISHPCHPSWYSLLVLQRQTLRTTQIFVRFVLSPLLRSSFPWCLSVLLGTSNRLRSRRWHAFYSEPELEPSKIRHLLLRKRHKINGNSRLETKTKAAIHQSCHVCDPWGRRRCVFLGATEAFHSVPEP